MLNEIRKHSDINFGKIFVHVNDRENPHKLLNFMGIGKKMKKTIQNILENLHWLCEN